MKHDGVLWSVLLSLLILTDSMAMTDQRQRYISYDYHMTLELTKRSHSPQCNICQNDVAICCPLTVACGSDGKCPQKAKEEAGYVEAGQAIVQRT